MNAPPAKGIRAGYGLLHELGAIDDAGVLNDVGRELAHLPVDPTVGRMILQARTEKAMREVLIIAAALSIQDPRERPLDQQQKADLAHRRFNHPDSDFLALLAIWEIYHDEFEKLSLGKLRKFCTAHFLSFTRMREWRDVHSQLEDTLRGRDGFMRTSVYDGTKSGEEVVFAPSTPAYRAIHRCILSGLLGNIATRTDEGDYLATHDRRVNLFPGSALFERKEQSVKRPVSAKAAVGAQPARRVARWVMAAEIMETARLYARTCARIDPQWVLDLGSHLLRVAHSEPFWNPEAGRVLVKERRRLYNLELETRSASYGKINPVHATEIFIREGLVGDTITWPFDFLAHNRRVREQTETLLTRTRSSGYMNLDEAVYRFYARELMPALESVGTVAPNGPAVEKPAQALVGTVAPNGPAAHKPEAVRGNRPYLGVSSVGELVDIVRHRQTTEPKFLFLGDDDLRPSTETEHDAEAFPEALPVDNQVLPLAYSYQPGQESDGVTLRVTLAEAEALTPAMLDWAIPGHLAEKVELMLKALPKELRRDLIPLTDTARKLPRDLALLSGRAKQPTLAEALAEILSPRLGVKIDAALWDVKSLPDHLRVRVEVVDKQQKVVGAGRDLGEVQTQLDTRQRDVSKHAATVDNGAWRAARAKWEGEPATEWKFGDLPEQVVVSEHHGVPVLAYAGLKALPAGVAVRLSATPEEAAAMTREGLRKLFQSQLRFDLGWLEKDLKALRMLGTLAVTLVGPDDLQSDALESIRRWVCDPARMTDATANGKRVGEGGPSLKADRFARALETAKQDLRGLVPKVGDWLKEIFTLRLAMQTTKQSYPGMADDLAALLPADFVQRTPFTRLQQLPRYLRAMQVRTEKWKRDPAKDAQRATELAPFLVALRRQSGSAGKGPGAKVQ
ncbi:MAG: DUF3418 domain-containing protein, partial [Lacunisphaera sp.]